jgi:hypothetical protein
VDRVAPLDRVLEERAQDPEVVVDRLGGEFVLLEPVGLVALDVLDRDRPDGLPAEGGDEVDPKDLLVAAVGGGLPVGAPGVLPVPGEVGEGRICADPFVTGLPSPPC